MSKIKKVIKMKVTPEQSRKVQEICFANGIEWEYNGKHILHDIQPYLFIDESISYMAKFEERDFYNNSNEEVSAELFIRTNGTCIESEAPTENINKGGQMGLDFSFVESEVPTEDNNNNKEEQREESRLECLVEGYEGTYFEVGQVWETRGGERLKVKGVDFRASYFKLTMTEVEDSYEEYYYSQKGEDVQGWESDLDLVRLIPTEEPQPKTLSEYLKENNAYESFVENCVEVFLKDLAWYKVFKSENKIISLGNIFIFEDTKEGYTYWYDFNSNIPKPIEYDMNEIVFAEVDKRIAEQKSSTKYMVFVEGRSNPKNIHDSYNSAEKEAKRLSAKEIGCNVFVVSVVKTFKSKVIVEEDK